MTRDEAQQEARENLQELLNLDYEADFTEWESEFLESVVHWKGDLTVKQIEKIFTIYERIMQK